MKNNIVVRVFTGRLILTMEDEFHEVELFYDKKKLKKGFGYIKGNYVYIYKGKLDKFKKSEITEGIYLDREGNYVFVEPEKDQKKKYHVDNLIELNLDKIFEEIESHEEDFILPEDIEVINNNAEVYVPTIKEDDDFLKIAIKKAIIEKKVNLKNYKGKFTNQYKLNNIKSSLNKETKMTVPNFMVWAEILGLNWELIIRDAGFDKTNPLKDDIVLTSEDF